MKKIIILSTLTMACHKTPVSPSPQPEVQTVNPPPPQKIKPPNILQNLPSWDDIPAPDGMEDPTPILVLSADTKLCYKEWHPSASLSEEVKLNGGRILSAGEEITGRLITCPEAQKETLLQSRK